MTEEKKSLKPYNTFGLKVGASEIVECYSLNQVKTAISGNKYDNFLFLGGGSNVLFTKDFEGLVIVNKIEGIEVVSENSETIDIKAYSGNIWHSFVRYCVDNNYGGIENLSLIPGTVGAAPMQNIGAYGVEIENTFVSLEALNLDTFELETFNKTDCNFAYRESVFKNKHKGKYFIFSVTFRLKKQNHNLQITYGDIIQTIEQQGKDISSLTIRDVSDAVIAIRSSKLPNPAELGNSGSFFKNPTVTKDYFENLKVMFPEIKGYEQQGGVKVAAGWLIEQCGWKGKIVGNTGSHAKQALVLVNYGNASGNEIYELALKIIDSVKDKFGITLEPEVNII